MFVYFSFCRIVCKANPGAVTSFEDILFPIFQGILQQDIQGERQYRDFQQCCFNLFSFLEFIPYVFQILSLLMENTPQGTIPEPYMQLLPCLLAPILWDRPANVSPLVRLLTAFATQAAPQIVAQDKLVSTIFFLIL